VKVDHINNTLLAARAQAEVAAQSGHDIFFDLAPRPQYEDQVINHNEIVQEVQHKVGKIGRSRTRRRTTRRRRSTSLSRTTTSRPGRLAARHLERHRHVAEHVGQRPPAAPKLKASATRSGSASRGARLEHGALLVPDVLRRVHPERAPQVTIKSKHTVEALKFMADIYQRGETDEIFGWDPVGEQQLPLLGQGLDDLQRDLGDTRRRRTSACRSRRPLDLADPEGAARPARLPARHGVLVDLEVRAEQGGGEEVPRRPRDPLQGRVPGVEVLQLPQLPGSFSFKQIRKASRRTSTSRSASTAS
jgi:hypothetical protein